MHGYDIGNMNLRIKGIFLCPLSSSCPCNKDTHLCCHKFQMAHSYISRNRSHKTSSICLESKLWSTLLHTCCYRNLNPQPFVSLQSKSSGIYRINLPNFFFKSLKYINIISAPYVNKICQFSLCY